MANTTTLVTVNFGGALVGVGSVEAELARPRIDKTPLGQDYSEEELGASGVVGSMDLYFDKSDHAALVNSIKNNSAPATMTITWNTAETWTGPCRIFSARVTASVNDLVRSTVAFSSSGSWLSGV